MDHSTDDLMRALGRIEGKLDTVLDTQGDHQRRIANLEKWRNFVAGGAAVIGGLISFFLAPR